MTTLAPGLADPVLGSQAIFRAMMDAMSRPGRLVPLVAELTPPAPLSPLAAALVLMLADFETSLWLDGPLAAEPAVARFLTFHSGVRLVADPAEADFALISDPAVMPALHAFAQGTPDYPDRSTTIIVQVAGFAADWRLVGPGIKGEMAFSAHPLPADILVQLADNRTLFPLGVDLILAGPQTIAALPRSIQIQGA